MNKSIGSVKTCITKTACPYCGVGCGVSINNSDPKNIKVIGDNAHPANFGNLCSKGLALPATLNMSGRMLHPSIDGRKSNWDDATDLISSKISEAIAKHGPDSVGFYVSGQLLTEDYYVVNKLAKGYIGTANIDTNSRLCMASSVAGHKRAFGSDTVPGLYEDFDLADLVVLTGSNLAWCHPILQQRITAAKVQNPRLKVVAIDPRKTATTELADFHLAINPDSDSALFVGLLAHLKKHGVVNQAYVDAHTSGFDDVVKTACSTSYKQIELATGLDTEQITQFYKLFSKTEKVVTVYSQGVNQSSIGTDKVNSIINCHLATGRIGRAGMGPFSITGQPNAMGGREVGGLSNMLAAHMDLENATHQQTVQQFWGSPNIAKVPGLKAVDLFRAARSGKIKFLWIMATNPVVSMPEANLVRESLEQCPFVVVSDVVAKNDTLGYADVCLPAAAWGEKDGTVTNSERCVSRQRAIRSLPSNVKPDWWAVCEVAKKLGHAQGFTYAEAADIFREHAALSGAQNNGTRDFDISACQNISGAEYDALQPFVWPWPQGSKRTKKRFFANGNFYTPDRRGRFVPICIDTQKTNSKRLAMVMNTGRVRDQWHTMTRTGYIPTLSVHYTEPFIELNGLDAKQNKINEGDIVSVLNDRAEILVRASISEKHLPGNVFVPMHWTDTHASLALANSLVSAELDPVSGQPALKMQRVDIARYPAESYSFAVVRERSLADTVLLKQQAGQGGPMYWSAAACEAGWRYEIASRLSPYISMQYWRNQLENEGCQLVEFKDRNNAVYRLASYRNNELLAAVFINDKPINNAKQWVANQLLEPTAQERRAYIVAGVSGSGVPDSGDIVCSCFMVGEKQIKACLLENRVSSVDDIGLVLNAGTNCGSCRGELSVMVNAHVRKTASAQYSDVSDKTCIGI